MAISQTHASFQHGDLSVVKEERYVFETEWYDSQASLIRKYLLTFYPKDNTAEMVSWWRRGRRCLKFVGLI
jgi:hypothetical protein